MNLQVIHSTLPSATVSQKSISLILSMFEGVLVPRKHSSMLRIKARFSLVFIHALILLLGSFLLLGRRSAVCEKKRLHSLLIPPKHENTSGVKIHAPLEGFAGYTPVSFSFHSFYEQLEDWCKWHLANGLKIFTSQKAVCPLIHNPLAGTSALSWLLVFEDFGSSSPVNGVIKARYSHYCKLHPVFQLYV